MTPTLMDLQAWVYPLLVILLGYLVLGITGFGSALVVVPLLAGQWPLAEVVALAIWLDIPASILHGGLNLKLVSWTELRRMIPSMAVGALLGLLVIGLLDRAWMLLGLGAYVAFVGLRSLRPRTDRFKAAPSWAHLAGLTVGLVEVMFATAGPLVVTWLQRRLDDVAALRATVPVVMVFAGSIAVAMLAHSDQIDWATLAPRWALAMPVSVLGVILGNRLASHISPVLMNNIMGLLLSLSGFFLIRQFWV